MNTNLPPFNNLKARQAVNYAVDRTAAVQAVRRARSSPRPSCQVLPPGFPGHADYCPYTKDPGDQVVGARPRQGQAARRGVRHGRPEGRRRRHRTTRSTRRWGSTSRACSTRSATRRRVKPISGEHPVHLHPEHQEQGADQRAAVVPGLPGGVGLPQRPVRLRVVPPRQRLEHQHRRLLRQGDRRPDAEGADARVTTEPTPPTSCGRRSTRQVTDASPIGAAVHARSTSTSSRSGSATTSSASSSTGSSTSHGCSRSRVRAGLESGPRLPRRDERRPRGRAARRDARVEPAGASPWALARRRLRAQPGGDGDASLVLAADRRRSACAAPLYADHIAHTDPFRSNLDGTTVVDGKTVPVHAAGVERRPRARRHADRADLGPGHYFLGADNQGRDVAARLLYGGRNSLLIGLAAALHHAACSARSSASLRRLLRRSRRRRAVAAPRRRLGVPGLPARDLPVDRAAHQRPRPRADHPRGGEPRGCRS